MHSTFDCHSCRLRKYECFRLIDKDTLSFISDFRLGELRVDAGSDILEQAASAAHFYTLYEGWTARRITLDDGRSQITNFALPGALLGIQAALEQEMDHSVEALTNVVLCVFPRSDFYRLLQGRMELAYRVVWQAARAEHFLGANITAVGQRRADEKVAYLFASLYERARQVGMTQDGAPFDVPLTQQHIADAMGLSIAHTQRVLREFAAKNWIKPNRRKVSLVDVEALAAAGGFDPEQVMPLALL